MTFLVLENVKKKFPNIKIYLWTGYYFEELQKMTDPKIKMILEYVDVLIDGPYIEKDRDVTLQLRGSKNQSIIYLKEKN